MMTFSAAIDFISILGYLGIITLDAHWLISITAYAEKIPEDCSVCGIGLKNNGERGRGGSPPENGIIYPWMVSIGSSYSTHNCLGTMIDAFHIVTAAHCVTDDEGEISYYGKVHFRNQPQIGRNSGYTIDKVIVHPQFGLIESESTPVTIAKYDIALVKLKDRIKCDKYKNPICLPRANFKFPIGDRNIFTGWSFPNPGSRHRSELLRHSFIKKVNFSECIKGVPETRTIKNHMLCQGGTQHRMCYGDSGGPLMKKINQKYYILGIASSETNTNCALNKPMIFTDVVKFLDWIQKEKKTTIRFPRGRQQTPRWEGGWIIYNSDWDIWKRK